MQVAICTEWSTLLSAFKAADDQENHDSNDRVGGSQVLTRAW